MFQKQFVFYEIDCAILWKLNMFLFGEFDHIALVLMEIQLKTP